ncbi:MAG: hypothetical protein MH204_03245 [Fimbriimonadaceae bacterium]|nr:hypothetical protein [Fimbriimonadaceae bacterium]
MDSPYYRGGQQRTPKREVDFDVIPKAWEILSSNWGPFVVLGLVGGLVATVLYGGVIALFFPALMASAVEQESNPFAGLGLQLMLNLAGIPIFALVASLMSGMFFMTLKQLRGQKPEMSDMFAGLTSNPAGIILAALASMVAVTIGSFFCYIPGIILGGLLMIAVPAAVDKYLGAGEALKLSWETMKGNLLMASLLYLVLGLVAGLGACLCLVGALVTVPLMYIAQAVVYYDMTEELPAYDASASAPMPPDPFAGR